MRDKSSRAEASGFSEKNLRKRSSKKIAHVVLPRKFLSAPMGRIGDGVERPLSRGRSGGKSHSRGGRAAGG